MSRWVSGTWPEHWPEIMFFVLVICCCLNPVYERVHGWIVEKRRYGISLNDPSLSEEDVHQIVREYGDYANSEQARAKIEGWGLRRSGSTGRSVQTPYHWRSNGHRKTRRGGHGC